MPTRSRSMPSQCHLTHQTEMPTRSRGATATRGTPTVTGSGGSGAASACFRLKMSHVVSFFASSLLLLPLLLVALPLAAALPCSRPVVEAFVAPQGWI